MKYWAPRLSTGQTNKKHAVKLSELKLELGLFGANVASKNDKVAIEITGIARNKGKPSSSSYSTTTPLSLLPFHRTPKGIRCTQTTAYRFLSTKAPSLVWDANDLCGFHLVLKDGAFDVAFHVLYGEGGAAGESKAKMAVVGKVSMSVDTAELLVDMKTESNSQHLQKRRRLPIQLKVNGLFIEATLSVSLRLLKLRNSHDDSQGPFENLIKSEKKRGIIGKVKFLTNKNNGKFDGVEQQQPSPYESDGSPVFDSDDSSNESPTSSGSSGSGRIHNIESRFDQNGSETLTSLAQTKTRLDTLQRSWSHVSWNRSFKNWSFKTNTTKQETLTTHSDPFITKPHELSPQFQDNNHGSSRWKIKEISSRDGQARVKTNVFFASFDQRSEQASGESACTVLVALIAHWLHSNMNLPTRSQFDNLITQGSSEWRRLCNSGYYFKRFPDKHFDLETIIEANLRPLIVLPQKSYTGFFSPEKFQCLKGAMSFDDIWDEINIKVDEYKPRIYTVSWNDHFFVLKVEADAYYIIDSLGERLFEGCQKAFIMKFDDSSVMYGKLDKEGDAASKGKSGGKSARSEILCSGKECCKEFIKRFLAAIPLGQLEKEERNKGNVPNPYLHRQLQIDFHYTSSSLPSSSAASSSSDLSSLFSSGPLLEA